MNKLKLIFTVLLVQLLIVGCSSEQEKREKRLNEFARTTERNLSRLEGHIKAGNIPNSAILAMYASQVAMHKPELSDLIDQLAKDSTSEGPIFQGLKLRLTDAVSDIPASDQGDIERYKEVNNEFVAINNAAKSHLYGQMLADPINVLADLSDGRLPRIDALSKTAEERIDGVSDSGAGAQLVGNPHYGSWRTNSSGNSLWAWYGQYAFFSSMMNRSYYYDSWSRRRGYSYYHDYGRSTYTSPRQKKSQSSLETQTKKKFARQGKKFQSAYAKKRATTTKISSQRSSKPNAGSSSTAGYSKTKTPGSYKTASKSVYSNSRSTGYTSSRSSFGGK